MIPYWTRKAPRGRGRVPCSEHATRRYEECVRFVIICNDVRAVNINALFNRMYYLNFECEKHSPDLVGALRLAMDEKC